MPFLAEEHYPVPTRDILSYYFDEPQFDQDRPLFIDALDTDRYWTANQARTAIRRLAAGFKAAGLDKGDCVCIHSFNNIDYPILVNGIAGFGGVYTGANPAYTTYELLHHLKAADVQYVIVEPDLLQTVQEAAKQAGLLRDRIMIFDNNGKEGFQSWRDLFQHGEIDWPRFNDLETAKNTTLARLFSSGTTGLPKAAMLSHYNLIAEHRLFTEWQETTWQRKRLVILPMFHAATAPLTHYAALRSGDECFIVRRFDLETYFAMVEKHQITEGAFVPPMVNAIINSPLSRKYSLKSLRMAHGGAAPLDRWSQSQLQELLHPDTKITQVWGMTETSCTCFMTKWPADEPTGSVGRPLPGIDSKLVNMDGEDITGFDVRGELCVRGPLVFQGYFANPEANARDFDSDGFFHTGDIAYCDGRTRNWYIVDRKKELVKVRGSQVAPSELEGVLLTHPKIQDTGIIGVPAPASSGSGEFPRAYIVKRPATDLTEAEVRLFMSEKLSKYKQLEGGIVFIDALPKSASGKILKKELREMAVKEMGESVKVKL